MKKRSWMLVCLLISLSLSAEPISILATPRKAVEVPAITLRSIGRSSDSGESVIPGVVDASGRFFFPLSDFTLAVLSGTFALSGVHPLSPAGFYSSATRIAGGKLVGTAGSVGFSINSFDGVLMNSRVEVGDDLSYLVSLGNALIFRDDSPAIRYVVYLVSPDGSARRMEHDEALASLPENVPGVTVKDGIIYYKGNGLTRNLSFSQVDDDGNFYSGRTVYQGSKDLGTINSTTDSYDNYLQSFIDNEGNFWAMDFTKDEKESLVLLYAGRDWGYREAPKKAVTTEAGLRVRLRASTDAFVLGSLGKGEAITILKTGETATIGGVTAPWYRIKKADGLIGWAFGGYIKVVE